MKAKTYYIHASTPHRIERTVANKGRNPDWTKVLVIPASSMDKVIERAAKAVAKVAGYDNWEEVHPDMRDDYRETARAAYRAGGFVE